MRIDHDLLKKLDDALRALPGIVISRSKERLERALQDLSEQRAMRSLPRWLTGKRKKKALEHIQQLPEPEIVLGGVKLVGNALDEFPHWGRSRRTTPKGGQILLDLYRAGAFPMKKGCEPVGVPELEEYATGEEVWALHAKRHAPAIRRRHLIEHPDEIPESEFSYGLLNDVFFRHMGKGSHTMTIGGIEVTKVVGDRFQSISRKSGSFDVYFSWTGTDDKPRLIEKMSRYRDNRSNDPARNWGLGRE